MLEKREGDGWRKPGVKITQERRLKKRLLKVAVKHMGKMNQAHFSPRTVASFKA